MTSAAIALGSAAAQRNADRRLSLAVGASLLIHAVTAAWWRPPTPLAYTDLPGSGGLPVLQAVLAGPPVVVEPRAIDFGPSIDLALLRPPLSDPLESLTERTPQSSAPLAGRSLSPARAGSTEMSIAVGTIPDPAALGPEYVALLAQRFPRHVQTVPMLLGAPVIMYPSAAIERGVGGRVIVLLSLDPLGKIVQSETVKADPLLAPAALAALSSLKFAAAETDGKGVPYWAIVEFVFQLGPTPAATEQRQVRSVAPRPRQPSVGR